MSENERADSSIFLRRYAEFRDASGSWRFEIQEYLTDLNAIVPVDVPPNPTPEQAYRTAVFLEGYIEQQKHAGNWSDDTLDQFESFESTLEVEAVAKALREIKDRADR